MTDQITPSQFQEAEGVEDWRLTSEGATAFFRTRSFAESARFVQAISELQGVEDHRPGVDVRLDGVTIHMITYTDDYFGPSRRDVELARQISAAARKLGFAAAPAAVQSLLIILGATNIAKVIPFWRAVLGYEPRRDSPDEDLVDPHDRGPAFWFEQMNEPRGDGGGAIHVAICAAGVSIQPRNALAMCSPSFWEWTIGWKREPSIRKGFRRCQALSSLRTV